MSRELVKNPAAALDALAREELGLNPDDLGSPWGAAVFSFIAFALGAAVPLLPFLFGMPLQRAVAIAAAVAGFALFGVGAALSLFTGRSALRGGLRMVLIGGGAGVATWLIGTLLGAAINYATARFHASRRRSWLTSCRRSSSRSKIIAAPCGSTSSSFDEPRQFARALQFGQRE